MGGGAFIRAYYLFGRDLTYSSQTMLIDPGQFRVLNELLQKECKGRGRIETMTFAATGAS